MRERQRRDEGMGKGAGVRGREGGVWQRAGERERKRVPARNREREGKGEWGMGET